MQNKKLNKNKKDSSVLEAGGEILGELSYAAINHISNFGKSTMDTTERFSSSVSDTISGLGDLASGQSMADQAVSTTKSVIEAIPTDAIAERNYDRISPPSLLAGGGSS